MLSCILYFSSEGSDCWQMGAAVLGVPVKPTIKEVDSNGMVTKTLVRANLWEVQTPQVSLTWPAAHIPHLHFTKHGKAFLKPETLVAMCNMLINMSVLLSVWFTHKQYYCWCLSWGSNFVLPTSWRLLTWRFTLLVYLLQCCAWRRWQGRLSDFPLWATHCSSN